MTQIARCDGLSEGARWSHLACSGLPAVARKKTFPESHIINLLLTKFVLSRWLDIGLVLFFHEFMDLHFVSVHKHAKKIASSRRSVSQGAVQKTALEKKVQKPSERKSRFFYFFARCFPQCPH